MNATTALVTDVSSALLAVNARRYCHRRGAHLHAWSDAIVDESPSCPASPGRSTNNIQQSQSNTIEQQFVVVVVIVAVVVVVIGCVVVMVVMVIMGCFGYGL